MISYMVPEIWVFKSMRGVATVSKR